MKYFCTLYIIFSSFLLNAQTSVRFSVKDSLTGENIAGAVVRLKNTNEGTTSGSDGITFLTGLPAGKQTFAISFIGYAGKELMLELPLKDTTIIIPVLLSAEGAELEEIIVSTTRTNSRIDDLPAKIEVLGQEDMDEESTIVPGNITSILGDLSIITIQHTSQVNGNDAIRMQGLDPKYTQIMRDGVPLYGGFSGSLGVLAIPPLDLKQVEIIKGSASTLYGGGAIGGLINFISKAPADSNYATLTLNGTSLGEGNFNAFASAKGKRAGLTLFGGANIRQPVDVNGDGFTEVPSDQNYTLHPRIFLDLNNKTQLIIGITSGYDSRAGGDLSALKHGTDTAHPFLQKEMTFRNTLDFSFSKSIGKVHSIHFKTAGSSFQRNTSLPGFMFNGTQNSTYTELNDVMLMNKHTLVAGLNIVTDKFLLGKNDTPLFKDYNYSTLGCFLQDDWQAFKKLSFQIGLRYDHHNIFGDFILPRVSLFYKPVTKLSIRLAAGSGYKTPDIFSLTEPSVNMAAVPSYVKAENSYGVNADISYHTLLVGKINFTIDQAFYYTKILQPNILITDTAGHLLAQNGNYEVNSYGTDTYVRLNYRELELYLGYNHTKSIQQYSYTYYNMPFNPKDKFSTTLAYSIEEKWRMGVEAAYTANQYIGNNRKVPNLWFMAAMIERKFKTGSIVLNCENLLDSRQSKYESLVEGTVQDPVFKPVWGSLEGRVLNLSIKLNI